MMRRFKSAKHPKELVGQLYEQLLVLHNKDKSEKDRKRASEEVSRVLGQLKEILTDSTGAGAANKRSQGDGEGGGQDRSKSNDMVAEVSQEITAHEVIPLLVEHLDRIDFESTKYVVDLFAQVMQRQLGTRYPAVDYIARNKEILFNLIRGYKKPENAIQYGAMLREACRHDMCAREVLESPEFYSLFEFVQGTAFDISSDSFSTMRDLLTRHKLLVADFLDKNFDNFFQHYHVMITSDNYVTKRQALKLLGELLLDRHNFQIMTRYISNVDNLKMIMNVLKSREKQIAFEAFHCFKVFVANPSKPRQVHAILFQNQEKLIEFLTNFQTDRSDDAQFCDEKQYLIKQIGELKQPPPAPSAADAKQK